MKSEKLFLIVLIIQCATAELYVLAWILLQALSLGEKFSFDLLVQLLFLIIVSYGLYNNLYVRRSKLSRFTLIGAIAITTFLTTLMFGITYFLPGGIVLDTASVVMAFVDALLGIGAFLYYVFIAKRGTA